MTKLIFILSKVGGFLIFILAATLAGNALSYFNFDITYSFLKLKQEAIATGWYLPAYYSHVLVSAFILLIGFWQLHPTLGRRWMKTHRILGTIYVMGVLFFSAPGGLVMSLFIGRGPWVLTSFFLQGCLWFLFTALAYNRIRKHDMIAHREWMWRSFALTFAAITLRVYIFICSYFTDLSHPTAYAVLAWLSWVPNLLIVELYLRRFSPVYSSPV